MREGEDQMNQQRPRKANKYNAPVGGSFEATLSPAPVREVRCLSPEGRLPIAEDCVLGKIIGEAEGVGRGFRKRFISGCSADNSGWY